MSTPICAACDYYGENCLNTEKCIECKADLRDFGKKTGFASGREYITNDATRKVRNTPHYHRIIRHKKPALSV